MKNVMKKGVLMLIGVLFFNLANAQIKEVQESPLYSIH